MSLSLPRISGQPCRLSLIGVDWWSVTVLIGGDCHCSGGRDGGGGGGGGGGGDGGGG